MTTTIRSGDPNPEACPRCGSSRVARILYGEPASSSTLDDDIAAGRIVLGGCVVGEDAPGHRCAACGSEWGGQPATARSAGSGSDTIASTILPNRPRLGAWMVGRLVLTGVAASRAHRPDPGLLLDLAFHELRRRQATVRFLLTPAGFLRLKLSPGQRLVGGWDTPEHDFQTLLGGATDGVSRLLSGCPAVSAHEVAEYLVIGVDAGAPDHKGRPYGETALVIRTSDAALVGSTGKTFPNSEQQHHLIRNRYGRNHLMNVGEDRLAVLVCHDLVAFGKRSETNRRSHDRVEAGQALEDALSGDPTVVLHLPHTMDTARTFGPAWRRLIRPIRRLDGGVGQRDQVPQARRRTAPRQATLAAAPRGHVQRLRERARHRARRRRCPLARLRPLAPGGSPSSPSTIA